ncbi:type I restriction enzyme HsdR N-terminal domain-containing protein [uncultured Desulfosarcina sp.]|uniref:type I restriction enzyme HsdR N-terminal domain-containing protein n=1 Tax=uncultured Desulfosarcina sp. TaxID=218289 RepID=UPI0029C8C26B|nr:type I restriction enzyme HsdR N-terminal domain-containing protein [uncultured Desulfosarcina sp.]
MKPDETNPDIIVDFITGQSVPHVGPEINRQRVERYLVEEKGYRREEILVDAPIAVDIDGETYRSTVDLVVRIDERPLIAVKCAAGSLGSREREIVSAARLLAASPLPIAVVSDGSDATVLDGGSGKKTGSGMTAIPSRDEAIDMTRAEPLPPVPADRLAREKLVFRSYDSMNVNVRGRDK